MPGTRRRRVGRGTGGFSVDGSVRIAAHDRAGLERLLRYCARPPLALHRLRPESTRVPLGSANARLIYRLPRPAHDGRTHVRLSPLELLDRLARLVPPPRVHRHRYHGVFAANARWRREATRYGREAEEDAGSDASDGTTGPSCDHATDRGPRRRWAQLLARVYEVHPRRCPAGHRREALVSVRCASSPSSPTPQSSDPSSGTCGSRSTRPRSVQRGGRRRPRCWRSTRPHPGMGRAMVAPGPQDATPSIRACPEARDLARLRPPVEDYPPTTARCTPPADDRPTTTAAR